MKPIVTRSSTTRRGTVLVAAGIIIGLAAVLVAVFERGASRSSVPEDAAQRREVASPPPRRERLSAPRPALPQLAPSNPAPAERPSVRAETKVVVTQIKAQKYVEVAYPAWLRAHPGQDCPQNLIELNEYMEDKDPNDAWGRPMKLRCGAPVQSGGKGIRVTSYGRDGERSEDDIHFGD